MGLDSFSEAKWEKGDNPLNKLVWENWISTCKRVELDSFLMAYTKVNSKWNRNVNVTPPAMEALERVSTLTLSSQWFLGGHNKSSSHSKKEMRAGQQAARLLHSQEGHQMSGEVFPSQGKRTNGWWLHEGQLVLLTSRKCKPNPVRSPLNH